ncbi:hypothetical protein HMPREF0083_02802 [Aneurinibacillus aneurinilyticus ATCC 12856]|uniref:Uncharacterized protein n=1 Tax=Aneurinibacillus aneurinilyticus ATCC 12856 TaxID=649747 RepID=U1YAF0_ANEAE|nr:hypothetical protein HMPREF0083_02802 [Aneurinibacillus aneurinilyticus ATCC 12856]
MKEYPFIKAYLYIHLVVEGKKRRKGGGRIHPLLFSESPPSSHLNFCYYIK